MSESDPEAALRRLASTPALAPDPDLREWRAPSGLLATPDGLRATFAAMGFSSHVEPSADGGVAFQAWRRPRASGALLAVALGVGTFLVASRFGIPFFAIAVAVVLEAFYLPTAILPGYTVGGRISGEKLQLRIGRQGLLARPARLEKRLRFFLER